MTTEKKPAADWELAEKLYRAGVLSLRQISDECSVSHVSIAKRAKKYGWVRDLSEKILQTTQDLVARQVVNRAGLTEGANKERLVNDSAFVKAYAEASASIDMMQRDDLAVALGVSRAQMLELAALGNPDFVPTLTRMAEMFDESGEDANGRMITDKANELYRYIISLPGRVKMGKEIAGAHGVYIPLQRKVFNLDGDKNTNASAYEEMLKSVGKLDL